MMSVNPEPVLKTVAFIVLAPMIGMLAAFIISLWFIHSFRKSIYPKIISVSIIIAVIICLSMVIVTETSRIIGLKTVPANDSNGVLITDVFHNSPAWKMGLRKGDILLKIDDYPIQDKITLDNVLMQHKLNEKVTYTVLREDQNKEINNIFHTQHESRFWDITFYGENFKWILLSLIVIIMALFTLFLSSFSASRSTIWLKRLQLVSSAAFSIGHGGNDAQKVMGIITAALIAGGEISSFEEMPVWVPLACYAAIAAGTMSGGWKIIKTMGTRITKVTPFEGVAAETAGAITLFMTEQLKIPVSTTHTITGAIIGVGATKRLSAVRWGVTINLLWAWFLTIPVSALIAAIFYLITRLF
jgi:PiT family inorganic phosphate transporter